MVNVEDWSVDRIMQLPDSVFGARWAICCAIYVTGAGSYWDMSELVMPQRAVLWQLYWACVYGTSAANYFRLALGNKLPTSEAEMSTLEPLIPGFGNGGPDPRRIQTAATYLWWNGQLDLRMPLIGAQRRLVLESVGTTAVTIYVGAVISGFPREVPDWALLVPANYL